MSQTNGTTVATPKTMIPMTFRQVNTLKYGGEVLMTVADNPLDDWPFTVGYRSYTPQQMAAIAACVITILKEAYPPSNGTAALSLEEARDLLVSFATEPTMPF